MFWCKSVHPIYGLCGLQEHQGSDHRTFREEFVPSKGWVGRHVYWDNDFKPTGGKEEEL